jgi:hypothetical protein
MPVGRSGVSEGCGCCGFARAYTVGSVLGDLPFTLIVEIDAVHLGQREEVRAMSATSSRRLGWARHQA